MRGFIWEAESEGMTDFKLLPVSRPFAIKAQRAKWVKLIVFTKDPRNVTFICDGWCCGSVY